MTGPVGSGSVDASGREQSPGEPRVPRDVWLARWLWIAVALLGLLQSVLRLSDRRMLISRIREMAPEMSQSELDSAANSGILFTLMISAGTVALYVLLANRMVQGRNWARIVICVLAGFSVLATLLTLVTAVTSGTSVALQGITVQVGALDIAFGVVTAGLDVAILVLVFRADSNGFFRAAGRRRAARVRGHQ